MEETPASDPAPRPSTATPQAPDHQQQPVSKTAAPCRLTPSVERVMYIPRVKESTFTGKGGVTVLDWVDEIKPILHTSRMSPVKQANFIYEHLGGEARDEIRYRSGLVMENPDCVLKILHAQFGCTDSPVALMSNFLSRKQQKNETLREYANALFRLMDIAVTYSPGGVPASATLLRDQFVENISDRNLSRALKGIVRENPCFNLHDIRDAAIMWLRDGRQVERPAENSSIPSTCNMQQQCNEELEP